MAEDGADRKVSGTQAMNTPERAESAAGESGKPAVSPTVIDAGDQERPNEAPPWAAPGRTQPGEPPLIDVAAAQPPRGFAAPAQPQNVPVVAPPPIAPMVPRYPPAMAPAPRRGGSNLGLIIGGLVGLAMVIGVIAVVIAFRPAREEPTTPLGDFGSTSQPTEVKPEVPVAETTSEPAPEPALPPPPKPVVTSKPKPKPTTTAQPTATTQPTSQPTSQPTAQPTSTEQPLPPPPPPNTTRPRLKLPPK
jgi:hypothetical protein